MKLGPAGEPCFSDMGQRRIFCFLPRIHSRRKREYPSEGERVSDWKPILEPKQPNGFISVAFSRNLMRHYAFSCRTCRRSFKKLLPWPLNRLVSRLGAKTLCSSIIKRCSKVLRHSRWYSFGVQQSSNKILLFYDLNIYCVHLVIFTHF